MEISASNPWCTALPDWEERIMSGRSLVPELPLFQSEAARALRIFKRLRVPDLIGTPTLAEACGPWFFPIVETMFGSYDTETHRRMIQEYFLLVPKKNSKSSYGGPAMLTAMIMNERPEAEFNLIAPTMKIANIAFKQTKGTISLDPELVKLFHIRDHIKTIEHRKTGAELVIKAADTDVITGGKALGTMIDETHVLASKNKADDIYLELRGALAARPDGFLFQTTTQSKAPPDGEFKAELETVRNVRDGNVDLPILPVLYEYPETQQKAEDWQDRKTWHFVNPNIGRSVDMPFLEREFDKAKAKGKEQLALFASQHLNVEIGIGLHTNRWDGADYWLDAADAKRVTVEQLFERCEVVTVGIDGGGLDDLLGLGLCGRCRTTKDWLFCFKAWAHPDALKARKENIPKYNQFADDGDLTICEHPTQDVEELADLIERFNDEGLLPEAHAIGLDPVGVAAITDELSERGISEQQMSAVPQGYKLTGVIKGFARRLKDGRVWHDGSAMMVWVVSNAKKELRGNAVLITKQMSGVAKIDPLLAGFNAFFLMERNPDSAGSVASPWEDEDFRMTA